MAPTKKRAKALRREAVMPLLSPEHARLESRKLYTVLLDALHTQAPEFLPWAAEAYFWHAWKQQFPDAPASSDGPDKTSAEVQRERLLRQLRQLRKTHGNRVALKESFSQETEAVRFGLLWRAGPHEPWKTLGLECGMAIGDEEGRK